MHCKFFFTTVEIDKENMTYYLQMTVIQQVKDISHISK